MLRERVDWTLQEWLFACQLSLFSWLCTWDRLWMRWILTAHWHTDSIISDVHIDLFCDSWFSWIHQNSWRFDPIQLIYDEPQNRIQLTIHNSGEQHRRFNSQFNSPMIAYTRFNSRVFNKTRFNSFLRCVQLSQVLLVISHVSRNFAGLTVKIPYISDTW